MNILILLSQPWRVDGAETHVQALVQGLYHEHKITLAINHGSDQDKAQAFCRQYPDVQMIEIQARGINVFHWVVDILKLTKLVKNQHIDIISAQQRTAGLWAHAINKMTGIPFVVTMHDAWHRAFGKRQYSRLFGQMITVSNNLVQLLVSDFGFAQDKVTAVCNGVDFDIFTQQEQALARHKLNLAADAKIILHVSRLNTTKGGVSLALLSSIEYLAKNNPDCQIIIIGEGSLRPEVEKLAREVNKTSPIKAAVKDFTSDIKTWYAAADVVVAEGRVAIEALACQRPVVAILNEQSFFGAVCTDNIDEAIKVNFEGRNLAVSPEVLAGQIEKALALPVEERLAILQQLKDRMNIAAMTGEYLAVFQQVLKLEDETHD